MAFSKNERRQKIKKRIRHSVTGTPEQPRMSVFRSNKSIYVQLIDDVNGTTLVAASSTDKVLGEVVGPKQEIAEKVGELVAKKAMEAGIATVVFDRNGYLYHGRVKCLAEGARKGGLKF